MQKKHKKQGWIKPSGAKGWLFLLLKYELHLNNA